MKKLNTLSKFYYEMLLIRTFEEEVLRLFSEGKLFGTTHGYIGQEANAVGIINNLNDDDIIVSNHRCHGHYLALKKNPYALLCELMGKEDSLCGGRGGSQHICDGNFLTNGVQGGIVPLAAGLAFAEKVKKSNKIVTVFIGDGTLGQGILYESLNITSKWRLPLLFVIENNRYAQSTKIENTLAGTISERFTAFGIHHIELSTFDVRDISLASKQLINKTRKNQTPHCLILNTYRFASHSKSDDGRDKKEVEQWIKNDPLTLIEKDIDPTDLKETKESVNKEIDRVVEKALQASFASNV